MYSSINLLAYSTIWFGGSKRSAWSFVSRFCPVRYRTCVLRVHLFIYLFVYLFTYIFIYSCIYLFHLVLYVCIHLSIHESAALSIYVEMELAEADAQEERVQLCQQNLSRQVPHLERERGFSLDVFIYQFTCVFNYLVRG